MDIFFFEEAIIRTAALPSEFILEILNCPDESWIQELKRNQYFMNSIFLASPSLYTKFQSIDEMRKDHKEYLSLKNSIIKYAKRISTRSTPFGLFSGSDIVKISNSNSCKLTTIDNFKIETSLDMDISVKLASHLADDSIIQKYLYYSPNTSIYNNGHNRRLVNYEYSELYKRKYKLISIFGEEPIGDILHFSKNGKSFDELLEIPIFKEYPVEEVSRYVKELIDSQVLVSELEPTSLGDNFEIQIAETLKNIACRCELNSDKNYILEKLKNIKRIVSLYPTQVQDILTASDFLEAKCKAIGQSFNDLSKVRENKNLLKIDLQINFENVGFEKNLLNKVSKSLEIIRRLTRTEPNPSDGRLSEFKKAFVAKYDTRAVPLPEVLDVEMGIGYGAKLNNEVGDSHPLLDNLPRDYKIKDSENILWNDKIDGFWLRLINEASSCGSSIIHLKDSDLIEFEKKPLDYAASFVVKTGMYKKGGEDFLHVEFFGGHTATSWIGRFCNGNAKIKQLYDKIIAHEKKEFIDFEVAEVDHLPQAKLGNVILRPNSREKIIPYVVPAKSKDALAITDLLIMVENDTVFLKSKSGNKFIAPFYSNAFNIGLRDNLPIFQFLGDLSIEYSSTGGRIDLSHLHRMFSYIPRIEYGNVILYRATWKIKSDIFSEFSSIDDNQLVKEFKNIVAPFKIPEFFILKNGDNELLVKSSHINSLRAFLSEITKSEEVLLTEFLLSEFQSLIKDGEANNYHNEVLLFVGGKRKVVKIVPQRRVNYNNDLGIQEEFVPGSEWIYYKLYLGYKSADIVLNRIAEFLFSKKEELSIEKWFYMRYYDDGFHIRLRINVTDAHSRGKIIISLGDLFRKIDTEQRIGRIAMDTYTRELMRYGYSLIGVFEELFYFDSLYSLKIINFFSNSKKFKSEDLWIGALLSINNYCEVFIKDDDEILKFLEVSKDSFAIEFSSNKFTTKEINKRYSENRSILQSIILNRENQGLQAILEDRHLNVKPLYNKIQERSPEDLNYYLNSIIHMSVNRIFRSNQRMYEYLLFAFLLKLRTTQKHIKGK
ncbi:lantibiotic dehydratase [Gelidibacter sp. F2691]|nr:lantibiotic dehydratase [Gelidibacter sp. F2691]